MQGNARGAVQYMIQYSDGSLMSLSWYSSLKVLVLEITL